MLGAIFFPFRTEAAARMSSILELVHEPMKILSTLTEFMGVLASRLIYFKAFEKLVALTLSETVFGSGIFPSMDTTISGEVPQVTCGFMSLAAMETTLSNLASSSECSVFQ